MPHQPTTRRTTLGWAAKASAASALLALASCGALNTPTAQTVAGATPSGTVTLDEVFAAGYGGGSGTLTFNGGTYPFDLVGTILGPGGAAKIMGSGEVYF